jgi:hypothetical protein
VEEGAMTDFKDRILRAAKLDVHLYEEVEADRSATSQALAVVLLAGVATGIGAISESQPLALLVLVTDTILTWVLWAWLNYLIGTKLLSEPQTEADWGQLLRTMGFAYTPRVLAVLTIIPALLLVDKSADIAVGVIILVLIVWTWVAMVIAVRQALDYKSTLRAAAVTLAGIFIAGLILSIAFAFLGRG